MYIWIYGQIRSLFASPFWWFYFYMHHVHLKTSDRLQPPKLLHPPFYSTMQLVDALELVGVSKQLLNWFIYIYSQFLDEYKTIIVAYPSNYELLWQLKQCLTKGIKEFIQNIYLTYFIWVAHWLISNYKFKRRLCINLHIYYSHFKGISSNLESVVNSCCVYL